MSIPKMEIPVSLQTKYTKAASSIEITGNKPTNISIELPADIENLIDNKAFRNKFKRLIKDGFESQLHELAAMAAEKDKPSRWFAVVTGKKCWERTMQMLAKLHQVVQNATEVAKRVMASSAQMKPIYKACWRLGDNVLKHAITAQETGRNRFKYFCWLTSSRR